MAVERLEITSREAFADGRTFGEAGAYERIDGIAHFSLDPGARANAEIVDIAHAERSTDGLVRFDADFTLLRPVTGGARRLVLDIPNRGTKPASTFLNRAVRPLVPVVEVDPGDGFLYERGWTVGWVGWQWDVADHPALLGLRPPEARIDGALPPGQVRIEIACAAKRDYAGLRDETLGPSTNKQYPTADVNDPGATMTVQEVQDGPATTIPRNQWRFAKVDGDGNVVPDDCYAWIEGGFQPGKVYTVTYTSNRCPVVGVGLAATRDFGSFLRYERDPAKNPLADAIDFAYTFGVSQSGRYLRTLLYHGMNTDETGRAVFDGVHVHIGAGRRGDFNVRYGMPAVEGTTGLGHLPPYADEAHDGFPGLLDRQRASGGVPRIISTNTASEYWRGDAPFVHLDLAGEDLDVPEYARVYAIAGCAHSPGILPFMDRNPLSGDTGRHLYSILDYRPIARAALVNLDRWVSEAVEPPESVHPRRSDGTAVDHDVPLAPFRTIPGAFVPSPDGIRTMKQANFGPEAYGGIATFPPVFGANYTARVSATDSDGNETGGIRLPDVTAAIATYAGWNPRHPDTGGEGQLLRLAGSTIPFAKTAAEREATNDPRPSIAERFASREKYAEAIASAADDLIATRHALASDSAILIEAALQRWDAIQARNG